MRLDGPELLELLAQRFVLGTQVGAARRRFAAIAAARPAARRAVDRWENRLAPLAWALNPVEPSDLVWQRICRELRLAGTRSRTPAAGNRWAAVAATFAVLAIVAAGGWWRAATRPPETVTQTVIEQVPEEVAVALVSSSEGQPLWITRIAPASRVLMARVVSGVERRPQNDYELWALTGAGVPVSLGLLPQTGRATVGLDDEAIAALATSSTLAVSLEPIGGSPGATPTGPVLYTAALLAP